MQTGATTYEEPRVTAERLRLQAVRRNALLADLALAGMIPDVVLAERLRACGAAAADLKAVRRAFAKINHPDRAGDPAARERANRRVSLANAAIDAALASLKRKDPTDA